LTLVRPVVLLVGVEYIVAADQVPTGYEVVSHPEVGTFRDVALLGSLNLGWLACDRTKADRLSWRRSQGSIFLATEEATIQRRRGEKVSGGQADAVGMKIVGNWGSV